MCTATWLHTSTGYEFLFNRDERFTRSRGRPPELVRIDGVRCMAPTDADCGGTWVGVNEFGVSFGLLNAYSGGAHKGTTSRGLLLRNLLSSVTAEEFANRLSSLDLGDFRPFTALCIEPGYGATSAAWDGRRLWVSSDADVLLPFTSSSFETAAVCRRRRDLFRAAEPDSVDALLRYHAAHDGAPGPTSVCMHRSDAATVSQTRIRVSGGTALLEYVDGAPCCTDITNTTELHLR